MFDRYPVVMHKELDLVIMVPNQWPARTKPLLMTLVGKIVERFKDSSPIVRVSDIPTRLIRRNAPAEVYYVFNLVAPKEIVGAYIHDVTVPENEEAIRLEITSGTTLNAAHGLLPFQGALRYKSRKFTSKFYSPNCEKKSYRLQVATSTLLIIGVRGESECTDDSPNAISGIGCDTTAKLGSCVVENNVS